MFVVVVEFTTHPGNFEAFVARVRQQARDSLQLEPDCQVFDLCVDTGPADRVLLYEVYTDKSAFDAHLASDHFHNFDAAVKHWVSDRKLSTYTRLDLD